MKLRFHAQTGGATLTAQQIDNNIVRVTMQALAAVLGGCQSLHTNSRDEALALPTEASARIALRTQQIIAHESGVADTVDPVGGSYFVEALTNEIEAKAAALIEKVGSLGGSVRAIEQRFFQTEIAESAYKYQRAIEQTEKIIVGVNDFVVDEEPVADILRIDESVARRQIERLSKVRATRNNDAVRVALADLTSAAATDHNLLPFILKCVESYASVGEISDVLRAVWGEYKE
jgi:methylmalonyl-CoA mutase N-terminal domain/subunit